MKKDILNVTKIRKELYTIVTKYNSYTIKVDSVKGIGIYLNLEGTASSLVKTYRHCKVESAINYVFKQNFF